MAAEEDIKDADKSDTTFSAGSLKAALRAAGSVIAAIDAVLEGSHRNAFCCVRPPGHHAGKHPRCDDFALRSQTCLSRHLGVAMRS